MPTLEEFEERTKKWLVPGYIPEGCVTLLCADGGIGKTTLWCDTLAALTSGRTTIFDKALEIPFQTGIERTVMYFSKEDPTEEVLKHRLRVAGVKESNIRCFGLDDPRLTKIWYGSLLLDKLVEKYKPDIVVFDTLQAFLPEGVEMSKRKDMRDALNPLNMLGAKYGTAFLMIMHTNKSNASGRQRMADSSDIWDLGRSALMAGHTKDEDVCYLSHEKSNYGKLQKTILFKLSDDGIEFVGTSRRKDRDYMADSISTPAPTPRLDEAREFILENVEDMIEVKELEQMAKAAGIALDTLKTARAMLKNENRIKVKSIGYGKEKKWMLYITPETEHPINKKPSK
jgi:RecA-family ATPase